jgi:hypothetical protein
MVVSPYGFWSSPITSDLVVADAIRLDQVALDGNAIYWTESQPQKQGRSFVYRATEGEAPELVTPDDENHFNVRTRVYEYGGGSFVVEGGILYFSNFADQRLYEQKADNDRAQLRRLGRVRFDMQMASLTAGAVASSACGKTIRSRVKSSIRWLA